MKRPKLRLIFIIIAAAAALSAGGIWLYASDYYRADEQAVAAMAGSDLVSVYEAGEGLTVFAPEQPAAGLIFYPGGKVEHTAYAPLMHALAQEDILCVLTEMPLNLAVLDIHAADGVQERFSEVERWYIGGHSLGGSMAASCLSEHPGAYEGLILLASYSAADLSHTQVEVLSLYGTSDGVLNMEKYTQNRGNLPDGTVEIVLEGGNHAQFGSYGAQQGDGAAAMSAQRQLEQTVSHIVELIYPD